jgi:hypothetical protein
MLTDGELAAWYRWRFRLRCELANEQAQWLHYDIRGLLKTVCKSAFTFHSADGPLPRFRKQGQIYDLEIVVRGNDTLARRAICQLRELQHRAWTLLECGEPERRTLKKLLAEHPWEGPGEICLDFETPLVIDEPAGDRMPLGVDKLLRILVFT